MNNFIFFIVIFVALISCNGKPEKKGVLPYEKMQMEAVNFISQPSFSGDSMFEKLTGAYGKLEIYYVDTKQLYFTCDTFDYTDENLSKFVISKDSIIKAKEINGELVLGTKHYRDISKAFFKMPLSNFKVDSTKLVEMHYKNAIYKANLSHIIGFSYLKSTFGGGAIVITPDNHRFMNHGSVVAKNGEPSLSDFVKQMTSLLPTPEQKAQRLLNFVTQEIKYNANEATNGYETIKRPDEVLFTRNSDCSGKAILYASLLEQLKVKWCLLYFENHVCVGVAGNFKGDNYVKFKLKGTDYYLAEITDPEALIGLDSWAGKMNETTLEYYQLSESGSDVMDFKTNEKLKFLTGVVKE